MISQLFAVFALFPPILGLRNGVGWVGAGLACLMPVRFAWCNGNLENLCSRKI